MPSLTLKNVPRTLHMELKRRARARHRSLNQEAIATLEAVVVPGRPTDIQTIVRESQEARQLFRRPVTPREVADWKDSGRP